MKRIFTLITLIGIFTVNAYSQCTEVQERKVLLIGDSWAAFMNADQTINHAFNMWGHSNYKFISSAVVAENGADTWDFLDQGKQDAIQNLIDQNPSIEMIHVSIGGNDVLGDWHVSWDAEQTDSLANEVEARLDQIFDFLKSTRVGMRVFWGGYCYTNFEEVIEDIAPAQSAHPFYSTWSDMGFPENAVINSILNDFSDSVAVFTDADPDVDFVKATGLLQYVHGQLTPLGVAPGGTYQPFTVPLPEGDPAYPSPKTTMRPYGFFIDCFHLSPEAYLDLLSYHMQKFYHKFFMDDFYALSEGGTKDGSVTSDGNVSTSISFGDASGVESAIVLSFNTTGMADTTVERASIFLRRENVSGTNPIELAYPKQVKVISGNFGTSVNVEAEDFAAVGDAEDEACRFGSNGGDGHWIKLQLPASVLQHINNSGTTQFVIKAEGVSDGQATFSDASDPDFAPVLNVKYGPTPPSSVPEDVAARDAFRVYPNPTNGTVTIDNRGKQLIAIEVVDLLGKVVLQPSINDKVIDLSDLQSGLYVLNVTTENGRFAKHIVKR